jgi:hypothetical protein
MRFQWALTTAPTDLPHHYMLVAPTCARTRTLPDARQFDSVPAHLTFSHERELPRFSTMN